MQFDTLNSMESLVNHITLNAKSVESYLVPVTALQHALASCSFKFPLRKKVFPQTRVVPNVPILEEFDTDNIIDTVTGTTIKFYTPVTHLDAASSSVPPENQRSVLCQLTWFFLKIFVAENPSQLLPHLDAGFLNIVSFLPTDPSAEALTEIFSKQDQNYFRSALEWICNNGMLSDHGRMKMNSELLRLMSTSSTFMDLVKENEENNRMVMELEAAMLQVQPLPTNSIKAIPDNKTSHALATSTKPNAKLSKPNPTTLTKKKANLPPSKLKQPREDSSSEDDTFDLLQSL